MPFLDVLVHRATPFSSLSSGAWVEGERAAAPLVAGTPFDCVVFLPHGGETGDGRGRRVREPTMLYDPEDDLGDMVALAPEDEVHVVAPELNVAEGRAEDASVRWMVVGAPQPFGKPGLDVLGFQVTLRRVDDD